MINKHINEREAAVELIAAIQEGNKNINEFLDRAMRKYAYLSKAERAFISRLVKGTFENLICIDYIIGLYSSVKPCKLRPYIRNILRISVYQLMCMDKVPAGAVCNEAVKLAKSRGFFGLRGYVNAVLRKIALNIGEIEFPDKATAYSMPEWIIKLLYSRYGEETAASILKAFLSENPTGIRVNTSKASSDEILNKLATLGIRAKQSELFNEYIYISGFDSLSRLEILSDGSAYIQDIGSFLITRLAGIKKGAVVVDLCAAPGGKTLHAADLLKGSGKVMAFDVSEYKVQKLEENIKKSGFKNISCGINNAAVYNSRLENTADLLIADLPCSGLGVIGRKPDIKYNITEEKCRQLVKLQRAILENAALYIKPGGRLVYSTCTLNKNENEDNIDYFIKKHSEFKLVDLNFDEITKILETDTPRKGCLQLIPKINSNDGFFIAVLQKL